ncbi:MAG: GNAT family N-acetyltransferase [Mucilaginibacter polytrichastri]|nr:GNAT family N-acetyltransferase [Mucilaginibacter polytrichastri]
MDLHPFPTIETRRLCLRQINIDDAWEIYRIYNNERALEFIERSKLEAEESALEIIEKHRREREKGRSLYWGLSFNEQPEKMIGAIGFCNISKTHARAEIRYVLHPENHGKKLMNEAFQAVLQHGFSEMHLHRIESWINQNNKAAIALLRKQGFLQEALFTERHYYKGRYHDTAVFALLKNRFEPQRP